MDFNHIPQVSQSTNINILTQTFINLGGVVTDIERVSQDDYVNLLYAIQKKLGSGNGGGGGGTGGAVLNGSVLPIPNISLMNGFTDIICFYAFAPATFQLYNAPKLKVEGFAPGFLDEHNVYIEMLYYKPSFGSKSKSNHSERYAIAHQWSSTTGSIFPNRSSRSGQTPLALEQQSVTSIPPNIIKFNLDRHNFIKINTEDKYKKIFQVLDYRFIKTEIFYRAANGSLEQIFNCIIPKIFHTKHSNPYRVGRSKLVSNYCKPYYFKFRYIIDTGTTFIEGPCSASFAVVPRMPHVNINYESTARNNAKCGDPSNHSTLDMICIHR